MIDNRLNHVDEAIRQVTTEIADSRYANVDKRLEAQLSTLKRSLQTQVVSNVTTYVEERLLELRTAIPKDYMTGEDILREWYWHFL